MGLEIERKWILSKLPRDTEYTEKYQIEQIYLSVNEFSETRLKKKVSSSLTSPPEYSICIKDKYSGSSTRTELQFNISEEDYNRLSSKIVKKYKPIVKEYYNCNYGRKIKIEVSVVDKGEDTSFIYAEVEFNSEKEANEFSFPWPGLVIKEVTEDPDYYISNYWSRTRRGELTSASVSDQQSN